MIWGSSFEGLTRLNRPEPFVLEAEHAGAFLFGDEESTADWRLVPRLCNARRVEWGLAAIPTLVAIDARCGKLDAFRRARPGRQPDEG